jgi:PKD repeat protein
MRPLFSFFIFYLLSSLAVSNATNITVSGNVSGQWNADTVFVTNTITIQSGQTLIINAGCKVLFTGYYAFFVRGKLTALGLASDSIYFETPDSTGFSLQNSAGGWQGMVINNSLAELSSLRYCVFRYIKGSNCVDLQYANSDIRNSSFYANRGQNLMNRWIGTNTLKHCVMSNNLISGAVLSISARLFDTLRIESNTIVNNAGLAISYDGYVQSTLILTNFICWNNQSSLANEIRHGQYSSYGFDTSTIILRNCIVKNGTVLRFYNNSCFDQYPNFTDTSMHDYSLKWSSYPLIDSGRSIAIDNGYYLSSPDEDSTRPDIGGIPYYQTAGPVHTWAKFQADSVLGYQSHLTVHFTNHSNLPYPSTTWLWKFGDGTSSTEFQPVHVYTQSGNFTVTLIATDPDNHVDSSGVNQLITIYPGTRINGGEVYGIWQESHSPYYIYGDIFVPADRKLEIQQGVVVKFMGQYNLDVFGSITAKGVISDTVRFEAYDTSGMLVYPGMNIDYPYADFQRSKGWGGIHVISSTPANDSCIMEYCKFSDVRSGNPNAGKPKGTLKLHRVKTASVKNSLFSNNFLIPDYYITQGDSFPSSYHNAGIHGWGSSPVIENNRFENLYQYAPAAIYLVKSDSAFIRSNIFKNSTNVAVGLEGIKKYNVLQNTFDSINGICMRLVDADAGGGRPLLNEVSGNTFSNAGKAIYGSSIYKIRFAKNIFSNNVSQIDVCIDIWGDSLYVSNNLFYNNRVTATISNVGSTCIGIMLNNSKTGVIANNTLVDNYGFVNFQAIIYGDDSLRLYNNILWDKSGVELQGTHFTTGYNFSNFTKSYNNNVKGGYSYGVANFNAPPNFVDSVNHNYRLKNISTSINQGYADTSGLYLNFLDFYSNPRVDTFLNKVDVGIFEYITHKPTAMQLSSDTIQENLPAATFIGKLTASDPDTGELHTYSLVNIAGTSNNNGNFMVRNDSLFSNIVFNIAQNPQHVSIRTRDNFGAGFDSSFSISIRLNQITGILPLSQIHEFVKVFPVPFADGLIVEAKNNARGDWQIWSLKGELMASGLYQNRTILNLKTLAKSAYILKITYKKKVYAMTIVKL